jgi:hypothetical protein
MENLKEYIDTRIEEAYLKICRPYELDLEKINSIEDCKKILKFLCSLTLKPTPKDISYNGFEEVEQYFK